MVDEEVFPEVEVAGDVRLAILIEAQAGGEQHHIGVAAEDGARGAGAGDLAANGVVETLHALGVGEVILDGTVDAGEGVVIAGEPTVVLGDQLFEESGAGGGLRAGELGPGFFGVRAAGDDGLASADLEHGSVKIDDVRIDFQARGGDGFAQIGGGFGIELGKAEIEAAQGRIGEKEVDKLAGSFVLGGAPVIDGIEHRNAGGVVIEHERPVGAERGFELGERESGVDGEECSGGVDGFEDDVRAAAAAHAVAEDAQNVAGLGGLAGLDTDDLVFAAEGIEFAGLGEIADDELQILGLIEGLVRAGGLIAVGDDVAREGGEQVLGMHFRGEGGHAGEGA